MTLAARKVLHDAGYAIYRHNNSLQGEAFRASWFSVIGLLRAVGHVLKSVDSKQSPEMAKAIAEKFKQLQATKPAPEIFWEFIIPERNNFLKEYSTSVKRIHNLYDLWGNFLSTENVGEYSGAEFIGIQTKSIITRGPFANKPEQEVATEAYKWWGMYLDGIDELAGVTAKREAHFDV